MKMQDTVDSLLRLWELVPTPIRAALVVVVLTLLRFAYENDRRKTPRKFLELGICVVVTVGLSAGLGACGISKDAAYIIAVVFGWWGQDTVKENAAKWLQRKTEK